MHYQHWGITRSPFGTSPLESQYQLNRAHEESLARARYLIDNQSSVGLLLGAAGSGKSLLLALLEKEKRESGSRVARLSLTSLTLDEFLSEIAFQWGCRSSLNASRGSLWRTLADCLREHFYEEVPSLVLLDDVHTASPETLQGVERLAQADLSGRSNLTLLLACQQDRCRHLGKSLLGRCDLRIDLSPWDRDETAQFLTESLAKVGRTTPLFTEEAIARLHAISQGIPRQINQLADLALVAGAGGDLSDINAETIDSVYRELSVLPVGQ